MHLAQHIRVWSVYIYAQPHMAVQHYTAILICSQHMSVVQQHTHTHTLQALGTPSSQQLHSNGVGDWLVIGRSLLEWLTATDTHSHSHRSRPHLLPQLPQSCQDLHSLLSVGVPGDLPHLDVSLHLQQGGGGGARGRWSHRGGRL